MVTRIKIHLARIVCRISFPVSAWRENDIVLDDLVIHIQLNASIFGRSCVAHGQAILTRFDYLHRVFEPFPFLRVADGVAIARLYDINSIVAVLAALVIVILVEE